MPPPDLWLGEPRKVRVGAEHFARALARKGLGRAVA